MSSELQNVHPDYERNRRAYQEQLELNQRQQRAAYLTRLAELDLFDQAMAQMSDDARTVNGLDGLSADDQAKLPGIRAKVDTNQPLDPFERILLDKASRISEQLSKRLRTKTLRSTGRHNVQLLTIMAHSPIYPHADRSRALKMLADMRRDDPGLSRDQVDELMAMPLLSDAYAKLGEWQLMGVITREQADQVLKTLDHRNNAVAVDHRRALGKPHVPPAHEEHGA